MPLRISLAHASYRPWALGDLGYEFWFVAIACALAGSEDFIGTLEDRVAAKILEALRSHDAACAIDPAEFVMGLKQRPPMCCVRILRAYFGFFAFDSIRGMAQKFGRALALGAQILANGIFAVTSLRGKPLPVAPKACQAPFQMLKGYHPRNIKYGLASMNKNSIDIT